MFTVTYDFYSGARARRRLRAARIALCLGTLACILLSQSFGQTRCACTFWPIAIRKKTRP